MTPPRDPHNIAIIAAFLAVLALIMTVSHVFIDVQEHAEQWVAIDQCRSDVGVIYQEHARFGILDPAARAAARNPG